MNDAVLVAGWDDGLPAELSDPLEMRIRQIIEATRKAVPDYQMRLDHNGPKSIDFPNSSPFIDTTIDGVLSGFEPTAVRTAILEAFPELPWLDRIGFNAEQGYYWGRFGADGDGRRYSDGTHCDVFRARGSVRGENGGRLRVERVKPNLPSTPWQSLLAWRERRRERARIVKRYT